MKKIMKIFMALLITFSQLGTATTVLADEITSSPLTLELEEVFNEDEGKIDSFVLTYMSEKGDYVEYDEDGNEKTYNIDVTTSYTYLDGTTVEGSNYNLDVTGVTLNSEESKMTLDPISNYYDGTFNAVVSVSDGEEVVYSDTVSYTVTNTIKGLIGSLNNGEVLPDSEDIGDFTNGTYTIYEGKEYTQHYMLMPGELSPYGTYKYVDAEGNESEEMLGSELFGYVFEGQTHDFTNSLSTEYGYGDSIEIVDVINGTSKRYYYNSTINYQVDDDAILNKLYNTDMFNDGKINQYAKGYNGSEGVTTIKDLVEGLSNTEINLSMFDENGEYVDIEDEEVQNTELKNGYEVLFDNVSYVVVVKADNTSDNVFNSDDLVPTIDNYLNEENNPSMDLYTNDDAEEGTITFEDIMVVNENLKEEGDANTIPEDNKELSLVFGEVPEEIYIGETFDVDVIISSSEALDYIDGIDSTLTTSGKIKLKDVKFNEEFTGTYNDDNRLVGVGNNLDNDKVVMTLTFEAVSEGEETATLSGSVAKYLNIDKFEDISFNINVIRPISTDNSLSNLEANVGTFDKEFDKDTLEYTLTVPYDTEEVNLSGVLGDSYATVKGLTTYKLDGDKTVAYVTVTAEDGTERVYTITIVREAKPTEEGKTEVKEEVKTSPVAYFYSDNNYLKSLEIDGYDIDFDREVYEYKITVGSDVDSLDIKAIPEDYRSRVEITGNENFKTGDNEVIITVTAEDGSERVYKILVKKEKEKKVTALGEDKEPSNLGEKIVIIALIILVVLGLLYLIFKKDEDEE